MKNWNLQAIICFCGLFTWIYRLWLMVQIWWKFRTFTLLPSLPTSIKVNCCCCCIFSRELGWKCRRDNFLLNMGAHRCLDSLPAIRFMHSGVHVLAFMGWPVNVPCVWLSCSSWAGWAVPAVKSRAGSQQRMDRAADSVLPKVQALLWNWTCAANLCQSEKTVWSQTLLNIRMVWQKFTAHQTPDSCIATKDSDCGTDSRSSARWGVQRSVQLVDLQIKLV